MHKIKWITAIVIVLIGGYMLQSSLDKKTSNILRVAFPSTSAASAYEPTAIQLAPEYVFLENIYSPLVEMSNDGTIKPSVAESYKWDGDDLIFSIRKNLKTILGKPITPNDVEFSLKRVLVLTGNTHGNFKDIVCGEKAVNSIEDQCEGIRVLGDKVILKAKNKKSFLLPMLTAIDFAIIPKSSCDPKTLKIIDYRETSGPYYVDNDRGNGRITLKANEQHFNFSENMASTVELVPTKKGTSESSLELFRTDKVDLITTVDSELPEAVLALARKESNATPFVTMNIRSFVLVFTKRGLKDFSKQERFQIGSLVQKAFWDNHSSNDGYEPSKQFFPSFGEGGLSKAEVENIQSNYNNNAVDFFNKPVDLALIRIGTANKYSFLNQKIPNLQIKEVQTVPEFIKYEKESDMPHASIGGPDSGFLEDIGLISYSLAAGIFGMTKQEREQWLAKYMSVDNKEDRLILLKELHKNSLNEPTMIPLVVAPYVALGRKSWTLNFSQMFANTRFWEVKHQ